MNISKLTIKKAEKNKVKTLIDLDVVKRKIAKKYKVSCPSNVKLLKAYQELVKNKEIKKSENLEKLLRKRKIRSLSGLVIVSLLTKPYHCPGKCIYCPTEKEIPKSYLSEEPAVMRALANDFNPFLQIQSRIKALKNTGHPTDKIDIRVIGGTWSYYPKQYQSWFIKRCFQACNEFNKKPKNPSKSQTLKEAQKINEKAKHRIIGISIETRPDFIDSKEIKNLRKLGVTNVELGAQSIYDDVLKLNKRGHGVKELISATKFLKNAGFKICYQMMPNLPGSNLKRDKEMFNELFQNPDFQPDFLKIYPLALLKEVPLYKLRKKLKYKPYSLKELTTLLKEIKKQIPYYCRIQRIIRDFPSQKIIEGGVKVSNLRQIIAKEIKKEGWQCKCIRCREVMEDYNPKEKLYLFREDYNASDGKEIFLSFENKKRTKIYSLLRLRIIKNNYQNIMPVLKDSALIREIHTYGQLHSLLGPSSLISPQHKGLGKKLLKEAEKITKKEFGLRKIAVISGIGARTYFKKLGYKLKNTYMKKYLK